MSEAPVIGLRHFDEARVDDVTRGRTPLTAAEREFLCTNTPTFEECEMQEDELRALSDAALMNIAFAVWSEYALGQM